MSKTLVGPRDWMSEWLTCLLRVILLMWIGWLMCFIDSTSLRSHRRLNQIKVDSHRMFTWLKWLLG